MAAAAQLYRELEPPPRQYVDRRFQGSDEEFHQALAVSKTVRRFRRPRTRPTGKVAALPRRYGRAGGTLTRRTPAPTAPRVARVTRPQVYVGNLSFYTSETQLYEVRTCATPVRGRANPSFRGSADRRVSKPTTMQVFSKVGEPKRIIMGLDRERRTTCGFCFIAYYTREVRLALHEGRVRRRTTADLSDANFSSLIGGRRPPSSALEMRIQERGCRPLFVIWTLHA